MPIDKIKTFPLTVTESWLERLGKSVNLSKEESKHEFLIKAAEEKMERLERKSETTK